jgi:hypothetical protein
VPLRCAKSFVPIFSGNRTETALPGSKFYILGDKLLNLNLWYGTTQSATVIESLLPFDWELVPNGQARRTKPPSNATRNSTRKMKNRTFAIPAAATAIPPKPKIAAMIAIMKNPIAQRSEPLRSSSPV